MNNWTFENTILLHCALTVFLCIAMVFPSACKPSESNTMSNDRTEVEMSSVPEADPIPLDLTTTDSMTAYLNTLIQQDSFWRLSDALLYGPSGYYQKAYWDYKAGEMSFKRRSMSATALTETGPLLTELNQIVGMFYFDSAAVEQEKYMMLWADVRVNHAIWTALVIDPARVMTTDEISCLCREYIHYARSIQHRQMREDVHVLFFDCEPGEGMETIYENLAGEKKSFDPPVYVEMNLHSLQMLWAAKGIEYTRLSDEERERTGWEMTFADETQVLYLKSCYSGEERHVAAFARYDASGKLIEWQGGTKPAETIQEESQWN